MGYNNMKTNNATLDQQLAERDLALDCMKEHLKKAEERMKMQAAKKRMELEFKEGD